MKKAAGIVLKAMIIVLLSAVGILIIHFTFIQGVDLAKQRKLHRQCLAYAQNHNVELIREVNAFTLEENPDYAVCEIRDLYEKLVFIDPQGEMILYRNARSYQPLDIYDPADQRQTLTLSLHEGKPVYVYKNIRKDRFYAAYYSFDERTLLFSVDSEEE